MNCDDARRLWNLYHDSEGDAELHFQIGEHLATCSACAEWFHQESRLEDLITERLKAVPATPALWERIASECRLVPPSLPSRRLLLLASVTACAAALAIAFLGLWRFNATSEGADLSRLTAGWHERLIVGQEPVPFQSRSDIEVEQYLRHRVSFPVRCPPRVDAGFAVRGTGVCDLADQPTAFLVGDVGDVPVSIFVLPRESLDAFPHQRDAIQREGTHQCREGDFEMALRVIDRNVVLVIGRTEPERLLKVLNAYGSYHETGQKAHARSPLA